MFVRTARRTIFTAALALSVSGAASSALDAAVPSDLSGAWTYYDGQGKSQISQSGDHVTMELTWTPNSEPGPHYVVDATLRGRMMNGLWRCKATACHHGTGKFHAEVNPVAGTIRVSRTQDPGGANRWNGLVLVRSSAR